MSKIYFQIKVISHWLKPNESLYKSKTPKRYYQVIN